MSAVWDAGYGAACVASSKGHAARGHATMYLPPPPRCAVLRVIAGHCGLARAVGAPHCTCRGTLAGTDTPFHRRGAGTDTLPRHSYPSPALAPSVGARWTLSRLMRDIAAWRGW